MCVCACAWKTVCVHISACLCAHPRARQRHRVCSVIIKSLAGVQRRYEYDCNLSPPMMERLSHTQMSTCLSQPIERAHRFKFKRFSPSKPHSVITCAATYHSLSVPAIFQSRILTHVLHRINHLSRSSSRMMKFWTLKALTFT